MEPAVAPELRYRKKILTETAIRLFLWLMLVVVSGFIGFQFIDNGFSLTPPDQVAMRKFAGEEGAVLMEEYYFAGAQKFLICQEGHVVEIVISPFRGRFIISRKRRFPEAITCHTPPVADASQ